MNKNSIRKSDLIQEFYFESFKMIKNKNILYIYEKKI
jgi:hypothetical protein